MRCGVRVAAAVGPVSVLFFVWLLGWGKSSKAASSRPSNPRLGNRERPGRVEDGRVDPVHLAEGNLVLDEPIRLCTTGREQVNDEVVSGLSDAEAEAKPT